MFFGCLGIFVRLVCGELAERTLHYFFLAPVRREVLVVGKFSAGALTTVGVIGAGILASFSLMYVAPGSGLQLRLTIGASLVHGYSLLLGGAICGKPLTFTS